MGNYRVKITGVKGIEKATRSIISSAFTDERVLNEIGQYVVTNIQGRTRQGKDADGENIKELSPSWIKRRGLLAKVNFVDPSFKQKKSNLTFSGQLLQSLKHSIVSGTRSIIGFGFTGKRLPYQGLRKENLETPETNAELYEKLKTDRPILMLSESMNKQIALKIRKHIRRQLSLFKKFSKKLS